MSEGRAQLLTVVGEQLRIVGAARDGNIGHAIVEPAVTLADAMEHGIPWTEAVAYMLVQCAGGVAEAHYLELYQRQTRNLPEVTNIAGRHGVTEMQRRRADRQILE